MIVLVALACTLKCCVNYSSSYESSSVFCIILYKDDPNKYKKLKLKLHYDYAEGQWSETHQQAQLWMKQMQTLD